MYAFIPPACTIRRQRVALSVGVVVLSVAVFGRRDVSAFGNFTVLCPENVTVGSNLAINHDVFIIGAPYGLGHSLSVGHVSGRHDMHRSVRGVRVEVLQTDAAVNMGNSGGPMFNSNGGVVGIVSQILSQSGGFEGIGFAVSSKVARELLLSQQLFWSGVEGYLLTDSLARAFNIPQPAGLLIQHVAEGSPGAAMGLRAGTMRVKVDDELLLAGGDVVLSVAGVVVADDDAVLDRIQRALAGPGAVELTVLRAGKVATLRTR